MTVLAVEPGHALCADDRRTTHEVVVDLVAPVTVGDEILVHAGVAIQHLRAAA